LQVLSTRKRKDANASEIKVQVAIFAFDLLYLNGEPLVRKPFSERRRLLKENFSEVHGEFFYAKSADPETLEEVQEILELSVKGDYLHFILDYIS
jgi:DNA ligase-1